MPIFVLKYCLNKQYLVNSTNLNNWTTGQMIVKGKIANQIIYFTISCRKFVFETFGGKEKKIPLNLNIVNNMNPGARGKDGGASQNFKK